MNLEKTSTNTKVKERTLFLKREIHELKMTAQNIKEELKKDIGNLREKKESNRNPGNKKTLGSNKKHSGRPIQ
jgi:hypothetical protein